MFTDTRLQQMHAALRILERWGFQPRDFRREGEIPGAVSLDSFQEDAVTYRVGDRFRLCFYLMGSHVTLILYDASEPQRFLAGYDLSGFYEQISLDVRTGDFPALSGVFCVDQ